MSIANESIKLLYLGDENSWWISLLSKIAQTSGIFTFSANPMGLSNPASTSSRVARLLLVNESSYDNFQSMIADQDYSGPIIFLSNGNHKKSNTEFWIHQNYTPLEIENLLLKQWTKFQLTNKNHSEKALNMAQDIIAMAAHDMRTPLTSVLGFCDIALDEEIATNVDNFHSYFKRIETNAKIMNDTISRYMTSFRANKGNIAIQPTNTNIRQSLFEDLEFNVSRIEKKGLSFIVECTPAVPEGVIVDRHLVMQVVRNLVDNAIKYTDAGHIKIAIDYDIQLGQLLIDISDSGQGIAKDRQQEIFHAYKQAWHSESKHRTRGGAGLGLNTAKKIATLMEGDVTLVSSKPNLGTTFRINIKAEVPEPYLEQVRCMATTHA